MFNDDFYNEPSEFEMQVDDFKQSLLKSVKEEFTSEMTRLRNENAELQEVKNNFQQIQRDYKNKHRLLEIERQEMERKARNERLSVLMKDFEVVMFRADRTRVLPPKCDKCNANRQVSYKTPLGKEAQESCECSVGKLVYVPREFIVTEFRIDRDKNKMLLWYKMNREKDYDYGGYESSTNAKTVYDSGMKYEDLGTSYEVFFKSQEDCQKYCDWLTEQKA